MKLAEELSPDVRRFEYDAVKYPFSQAIAAIFGVSEGDLPQLHDSFVPHGETVAAGDRTIFQQRYYTHVSPVFGDMDLCTEEGRHFLELYYAFVLEELVPHFGEKLCYQRIPLFKAHLPGNMALSAPHRDRDNFHRREEVNLFLPFTDARDSATIWTELEEGGGDMYPLEAAVGECYLWNGANLLHMNKANQTGQTRVSVDTRFIPFSQYQERPGWESSVLKVPMNLGGYFGDSTRLDRAS